MYCLVMHQVGCPYHPLPQLNEKRPENKYDGRENTRDEWHTQKGSEDDVQPGHCAF